MWHAPCEVLFSELLSCMVQITHFMPSTSSYSCHFLLMLAGQTVSWMLYLVCCVPSTQDICSHLWFQDLRSILPCSWSSVQSTAISVFLTACIPSLNVGQQYPSSIQLMSSGNNHTSVATSHHLPSNFLDIIAKFSLIHFFYLCVKVNIHITASPCSFPSFPHH